ncbi:MAG: tetratricopeptide repeat protein [Planctomycetes bacterium]|nr:tetratricopeptide repeat protein [Planctomycetota bacterium]
MRIAALLLACFLPLPTASCQQPQQAAEVTVSALRERAAAAENQGRFGDAADAFVLLTQREPGRAEWFVDAGRCLGRSGRFREALDLLDGARKQFPGVIELPAMLARTMLLEAESPGALQPEILWTDAAALAEGVLQLEPDHLDSRLLLAQARFLLGEWDTAVAVAEEAVRRHPRHPGAHILIGRIATERFKQLLTTYERVGDTNPELQQHLVADIDAQRQLANKSFRRAAALDPSRAHPHMALAQLAMLDKKTDVARGHFADALVADPNVPLDHFALNRELDWQARKAFYEGILKRYLARPAHDAAAAATLRWHLGRALFDGEQWQAAIDSFKVALADDPKATNSYYYLCLSAYHLGDHDGAEGYAAAYAALGAPAFADVLRGLDVQMRGQVRAVLQFLGDRAFQQGHKEASRDINHVIACLVDSADAWNNHAFLCRETGRFDDAWSSYQHALEKEPESPQLWNDAAVILQYHLANPENLAKARSMYAKALELAAKVERDAGASPAQRDRAAGATKDARANLAELDKSKSDATDKR